VAVGTATGSVPQHEFNSRSRLKKRKKSKSDLTDHNVATAVAAAVIVGAALSTLFYGWAPLVVVSGSMIAAGWVLKKFPRS
jgi:fatty acid desaturase